MEASSVSALTGRTTTTARRHPWRRTACPSTSCPVGRASARCRALVRGLAWPSSRQPRRRQQTTTMTTPATVPRPSHARSPFLLPVTGVTWSITRTSGRRLRRPLATGAPSSRQVSLVAVRRADTTSLRLLTRKIGYARDHTHPSLTDTYN